MGVVDIGDPYQGSTRAGNPVVGAAHGGRIEQQLDTTGAATSRSNELGEPLGQIEPLQQ